MGIINTITRGASSIGTKIMGIGKKPKAQVVGVVTDGKGEIQSVSYDGIPHKPTSQKLREFNKKMDEKIKEEHPGVTQKMFGSGSTGYVEAKIQTAKNISAGIKEKITPRNSIPITWGGRPVGQVAGEAAGNMLRGIKKGVQYAGKSAAQGYTSTQKGYVKTEPERQFLQFMSGVRIPKSSKAFTGKNFVGGAKRGRKTKAEKKAENKEILYQRQKGQLYQKRVVENLKKNQSTGGVFSNFDLPIGMAFSNSESMSTQPFIRKTDNPYDINAHFSKNKLKL